MKIQGNSQVAHLVNNSSAVKGTSAAATGKTQPPGFSRRDSFVAGKASTRPPFGLASDAAIAATKAAADALVAQGKLDPNSAQYRRMTDGIVSINDQMFASTYPELNKAVNTQANEQGYVTTAAEMYLDGLRGVRGSWFE